MNVPVSSRAVGSGAATARVATSFFRRKALPQFDRQLTVAPAPRQGGLMLDEREWLTYPDGVQTPDGTIYVTHDLGRDALTCDGRLAVAAVLTAALHVGAACAGRIGCRARG